jgi:hypothetical protein
MKRFDLQVHGQVRPSVDESEVMELFSHETINRDTPCRITGETKWRTCDELLPSMKYGSKVPPSQGPRIEASDGSRIVIHDVRLSFSTVFRLFVQVMLSSLIVGIAIMVVSLILWLLLGALVLGLIGGLNSISG